MKKNLFYAITVIASCFAMVSCEPNFQNVVEVIGDYVFFKEKVVVKDSTIYIYATDSTDTRPDTVIVEKTDTILLNGETIYLYDTVYVEGGFRVDTVYKTVYDTVFKTVYDTVTVTKELLFDCYGFDANGNLVATTSEGYKSLFSYNISMTTSGDVYFKEEGDNSFDLKNNASYFEENKAFFTVRRGTEEMTLTVFAAGASSVIINNEEVSPCNDFSVKAELKNLNDREINGRTYQTAVVKYYFYNAQGNVVARTEQYVFAPKTVSKPVNKRDVTIENYVHGDNLIITGKIDNSLLEDTTAQVIIPLNLSLACGAPQTVYANGFDFKAGGVCKVSSSNSINTMTTKDNSMVVTYEEVETVFNHTSTASGTPVDMNPTVRHYDNFVVSFGGKTEEIDLGSLTVSPKKETEGGVVVKNETATMDVTIPYEATFAGLTANASGLATIIVEAIVFDNQRVIAANRTITFDSHEEPLIYDCVLTEANDGSHYYQYRQVVDNVPQEWKQVKLTADEYNFIADRSSVHGTYALAIHYRKEYSGPAVGKLGDNIAGAEEVAYFAPNRTKNVVKGSRFAVFGRLNTAIAGTGEKENDFIKMTTTVVTFAGKTISSAGTIYFY